MKKFSRPVILLAGPLLMFVTYLSLLDATGSAQAAVMGGIGVWMAFWWITEAVNLYVTSLLPLVLYPIAGVMPMKETAPFYTNEILFLFIGGFLLSFGIEKWGLHRRIAWKVLSSLGKTPGMLLLGFLLSGYFLSMWISNIATTMMLLPAVLAVGKTMEEQYGQPGKRLSAGLLLGLAYSSSIGGTATLVGTAPNMIFSGFYRDNFGGDVINFSSWMMFGLPVSAVLLFFTYFLLRKLFVDPDLKLADPGYAKREYQKLGPLTRPEFSMIALFGMVIFLWVFRADMQLGSLTIPGWSNLFVHITSPSFITDSTVAMAGALLLFFVPAGNGERLLVWEDVKKLPLGVIFLFGGGFALAGGITASGLSDWLALQLEGLAGIDPFWLIVLLSCFMTFFTELTSNTASTYLVLPILLGLSNHVDMHPVLVMLPVVFSASLAFMLPVATPPNTVVFGSEKVSIRQMALTGLWINIAGIIVISLAVWTLGKFVFVG